MGTCGHDICWKIFNFWWIVLFIDPCSTIWMIKLCLIYWFKDKLSGRRDHNACIEWWIMSSSIKNAINHLLLLSAVHKTNQSKLSCGLVTPLAIYSSIWSLNLRRASRTSGTCFLTIYFKRGASSERAVSFISSNQLLMKIPLSGCNWKFSATLSTMIVFDKSRPILLRSFTNTGPWGSACWR